MSKYKTEQRKTLIDYFESNNHRSLSAQDIHTDLKEQGISISAIYRNLAEMEKDGIVYKVAENSRPGVFYQYIDPDKCTNLIHLKCITCDATLHLNKHISQMMVAYAKDEYGFVINCTGAFMYGECAICSQKRQGSLI